MKLTRSHDFCASSQSVRQKGGFYKMRVAVLFVSVCWALLGSGACTKNAIQRPNVLLISIDTLRPDHLGCYGYERPTSPNIDKLSSSGVLFVNAVSSSSWTLPAHISMMTGRNPSAIEASFRQGGIITLAEILKKNGYQTAAFVGGAYVSKDYGFSKGFDAFLETGTTTSFRNTGAYGMEYTYKKVKQWLTRYAVREKKPPFFLFLHSYEPHIPYTHRFFVRDKSERIGINFTIDNLHSLRDKSLVPNQEEKEYIISLYDSDIKYTDIFIGKLLEDLFRMGLSNNTIIIFTSDHGEEFWEHYPERSADHGHSLYDNLIKIPLILKVPGQEFLEKTVTSQARMIDIFPTLLDLLGIRDDHPVDGETLVPLMQGEEIPERMAFSENTEYGPERKSLRDGAYKYIFIPALSINKRNIKLSPLNQVELFHVKSDPNEMTNIFEKNKSLTDHFAQIMLPLIKDSQAHSERDRDSNISAETKERLRALGYLQ